MNECLVETFKAYENWRGVITVNSYLASFSYSLLQCVTTNCIESFNSLICKLVGGKRMNLSQRNCCMVTSELSERVERSKQHFPKRLRDMANMNSQLKFK